MHALGGLWAPQQTKQKNTRSKTFGTQRTPRQRRENGDGPCVLCATFAFSAFKVFCWTARISNQSVGTPGRNDLNPQFGSYVIRKTIVREIGSTALICSFAYTSCDVWNWQASVRTSTSAASPTSSVSVESYS